MNFEFGEDKQYLLPREGEPKTCLICKSKLTKEDEEYCKWRTCMSCETHHALKKGSEHMKNFTESKTYIDEIKKNPHLKFKEFDLQSRLEFLGTGYSGYPMLKDYANSESICYCIGVGREITFEEKLDDLYSPKLHIIDPTPHSHEHVKNIIKKGKLKAENVVYYTFGIAGEEGIMEFIRHQGHGASWSLDAITNVGVHRDNDSGELKDTNYQSNSKHFKRVPVKKLSSLIKENNHSKINVLKMDIEGSEYGVIDDIIENKLDIDIITLEYHGNWHPKWVGSKCTIEMYNESVIKLLRYGYQLVWCEERFNGRGDHLFIKRELV